MTPTPAASDVQKVVLVNVDNNLLLFDLNDCSYVIGLVNVYLVIVGILYFVSLLLLGPLNLVIDQVKLLTFSMINLCQVLLVHNIVIFFFVCGVGVRPLLCASSGPLRPRWLHVDFVGCPCRGQSGRRPGKGSFPLWGPVQLCSTGGFPPPGCRSWHRLACHRSSPPEAVTHM